MQVYKCRILEWLSPQTYSQNPDKIPSSEANHAPMNDQTVFPRLFIDINSAKKCFLNSAKSVPSIPWGHRRPDKIKNDMNLSWLIASASWSDENHCLVWYSITHICSRHQGHIEEYGYRQPNVSKPAKMFLFIRSLKRTLDVRGT